MARIKRILLSIRLFSALVIQVPLRSYQAVAVDAVIDSCLYRRGLEFLWVFPRQSGKDEALAQLSVFLLTLFHRLEAGLVHVYPTSGQLATGITRLEARLDNLWCAGRWWGKGRPTRRGLGGAQVTFFSGHPQARTEGATANVLLIVNECQDQVERVVERRFTPMRASTNATALYVGTVRTTADYLWKVKGRLERQQAEDGYPRVFVISPYDVGADNPHYLEFVENQVRTKGRGHPAVKTEFFNEPVDVAAGLFPARRRALMLGTHKRLKSPRPGEVYAALIDVGGQDEAPSGQISSDKWQTASDKWQMASDKWQMASDKWQMANDKSEMENPNRDYTVCTVVRVVRDPQVKIGPVYRAVDVFVDQGSRHFQSDGPGGSLFDRLLAYLRHWNAAVVICDQTGVGQGLTDALAATNVAATFGFDFARSYGKARLGSDFLAVVETGRFKYFQDGHDQEGSDCWWFLAQCEHCGYELAEGLAIERGLRWGVSPSARVVFSDGSARLVHDDRLLSAALVAELDRLIREGKVFVATGESAVIQRRDGETREGREWA